MDVDDRDVTILYLDPNKLLTSQTGDECEHLDINTKVRETIIEEA